MTGGGVLTSAELVQKTATYVQAINNATTLHCIAGALLIADKADSKTDSIFNESKYKNRYFAVQKMLDKMKIGFEAVEMIQTAMMDDTQWTEANVINNKDFYTQAATKGHALFIPDEHGLRPKVLEIVKRYKEMISANKMVLPDGAAKNCISAKPSGSASGEPIFGTVASTPAIYAKASSKNSILNGGAKRRSRSRK